MAKKKTEDEAPEALTPEEVLDRLSTMVDDIPAATVDSEAAKKFLNDFRLPLVSIGANAITDLISGVVAGRTDAEIEAAYMALKPAELNKVMEANAEELGKLKSKAQREAGMWMAAKTNLSVSMASHLMRGVTHLVGLGLV